MSNESPSQAESIPLAVADWLQENLGDFQVVRNHRPGSERTGVWQISAADGIYYCKLNRRRIRWATELFAYRNWMPALRPFVPELCGVLDSDGSYGLLLSALEGVPMREAGLAEPEAAEAYRKAGEVLAKLHTLPAGPWYGIMDELGRPTDDAFSPDAVTYYDRILRRCLSDAEAANALTADEKNVALALLSRLPNIVFPLPVPTFFDFTPGNWIVDKRGKFSGIIDFENMAWGLPADPFARLILDYFPSWRNARRAFYDGYGRCEEEESPEQVLIGILIYGVFYNTYGTVRNKAEIVERGQRAFRACRQMMKI